ncbi:MAG TPA: histidine kinase N-terminal 7TM domain-containing protein [Bacillota bacterium]|nr:histidine kinase N-terminal 7TM domain-containing protein [Bacillota bacterium]HPT88511.1 histidine kinase N-terminal 7TM domain-containing protein [Bacillota bacterium]
MDWVTCLRLIWLFIGAMLATAIIVYCRLWGNRTPLSRSFIWYLIFNLIWFLGQIFRIFASDYGTEWVFVRLEYFGICFIVFFWLVFCLQYTEHPLASKKKYLILLGLIPALCYVTVLTNDWHHQFFGIHDREFNTFGILFYIHTFESYIYCTVGAALLINYAFQQMGSKRKQGILLVLAALFPLVTNILVVSRVIPATFDTTPFGLMISLVFYFVATFKYKLLDLVPVAYHTIVDNMKEAIVVIDNYRKIIRYNRAFKDFFPEIVAAEKPDLASFLATLIKRAEPGPKLEQITHVLAECTEQNYTAEFKLLEPRLQWLAVNVQPIYQGGECLGRVISISDVSVYQNLVVELHQKNHELSQMNQQLQEYAATAEELAIVKERNRFARDVHDTLGQTMTLLITLLQVSLVNCRHNPEEMEKKLTEAIHIAEEGLAEVRRSVAGLSMARFNRETLLNALQALIRSFETAGVEIRLMVEPYEGELHIRIMDTIYRVCQEALTNTVRHGKASKVSIEMQFRSETLILLIEDNGHGCTTVRKGYGLLGMEERIKAVDGLLEIDGQPDFGFRIKVVIPLRSDLAAKMEN